MTHDADVNRIHQEMVNISNISDEDLDELDAIDDLLEQSGELLALPDPFDSMNIPEGK